MRRNGNDTNIPQNNVYNIYIKGAKSTEANDVIPPNNFPKPPIVSP